MQTHTMKTEEMNRLEAALKAAAEAVEQRLEYYTGTPEGRAQLERSLQQIGIVLMMLTGIALSVAKTLIMGTVCKLGDCIKTAKHLYHREYRQAGGTVLNMQWRRVKAAGAMAEETVHTAAAGASVIKDMAQGEQVAQEKKHRLWKGFRNCAIAAGAIYAGSEVMDFMAEDMAEPLISLDYMPGVENGMLVDNSPENVNVLAVSGELEDTQHVSDYARSTAVKDAFLAAHGFDTQPEGWEVHHIVPLSEGGADSVDNMVLVRADDHDRITAQHARFYGWDMQY